jgi:hypothetical protein
MLYPTKHAGQEWYMNMENPTSDQRFNPQDHITRNHDGSWKMRSNQVRMSVYTANGYNPNQLRLIVARVNWQNKDTWDQLTIGEISR